MLKLGEKSLPLKKFISVVFPEPNYINQVD